MDEVEYNVLRIPFLTERVTMNVYKWLLLPALAASLACGTAAANPHYNAVLNDNPALYWNFNEASGTALNYGYLAGGNLSGQNGVRGASTTTAGGVDLGTAAQSDGVNNQWFYTEYSGGSRPLGTTMDSYVIETWTKATAHSGGRYLMEVRIPSLLTNAPSVIYNFNSQVLELYCATAGRTGATEPKAGPSMPNWPP